MFGVRANEDNAVIFKLLKPFFFLNPFGHIASVIEISA